ncbi:MAG: tetratricopeptide repeat protein, partial [Treponema sp.]|nr:tetratricopeptide repeat protein [Treponema sp.]
MYIILFGFLGILVSVLIFFIIKASVAPKRIEGIQKFIKQGKTSSAIKLAKSMISKDPKDYKAHYYLGKAYLADGKPELAFMEYKLVNQNALFDADIPEAEFRKQMSTLYYKFNQKDEALKEYLLLTKLEPHNGEHFFNAGKLFEERSKTDQAMLYYQKAVKVSPRHVKAHAALGLLYFRTKQLKKAKKEIDLAIYLSPDTFSSYYYRGKIYKEAKEYPSAINAFEKAVRDPEFKQKALIEKGNCYVAVGAIDKAISEYDRAVKVATDESAQETLYARYFLASSYEKIRNIDLALQQWEKIY